MKKLHLFPSASCQEKAPVKTPNRRSWSRRFSGAVLSLVFLLAVLAGAAFAVLRIGVGGEMLTEQARSGLRTVLGPNVAANLSEARLSLDQNRHLALEANDVSILDEVRGFDLRSIRSLKLGLAPLPLMRGEVQVAQLELNGADIKVIDTGKENSLLDTLPRDARGLVDLGASSQLLFGWLESALGLLDRQSTNTIVILDTTLTFGVLGEQETVKVNRLKLSDRDGPIALEGAIVWRGKEIALGGEVVRAAQRGKVKNFALRVDRFPVQGSAGDVTADEPKLNDFEYSGELSVALEGASNDEGHPERISGKIALNDGLLSMARISDMKITSEINFEQVIGSRKIEITPSSLTMGGFETVFDGAFGPEGEKTAKDIAEPAYRFEIVTKSAKSAPAESPEAALDFGGKIAGRYLTSLNRAEFTEISVRTEGGEVYGQGNMAFGGGSPGMFFGLRIPEMPVAHAKHLWPAVFADGARRWVLSHVYGGKLKDSRIDVNFINGRFNGPGDPPPLRENEVVGDFQIQDARFDVVGDIPPVRDAWGKVNVRGAHTTVTLEKGVSYTPNNRVVTVSEGTLTIPWGPQRPVLSDLDIRVKGEASAVTEIIGFKPINALRHLPFAPEDAAGDVDARVFVTFPVTRNAPKGSLKWSADMNFTNLDLAKPVSGQMVSDAAGKLAVDQSEANLTANARLNGIPAEIRLTEPLGKEGSRQQAVRLEVDDDTRQKFFPALNTVLSGPIYLDLSSLQEGRRQVSADLRKAELKLPWVGWKKGAGIAATARFTLMQNGNDAEISGLDIAGDTFRIKGNMSISDGALKSAKFTDVRLNRGDSLKVAVAQAKNGYRIDISGSSIDARALIKRTGGDTAIGGGKTRTLVNANFNEVTGFNSEVLHKVSVSYETVGSSVSGLTVNATTKSGATVSASDTTQNGARSIAMQSKDAGAVLRFFDYYDKIQGGQITVNLDSRGGGPLHGHVDARNFMIVGEPRLEKLVGGTPQSGTSLNEAVKRNIDVSRVSFDRGFSRIEKGKGYVKLEGGVLRGMTIGATFQGTLIDPKGNMSITGTFMPAYGVNRIFGEIPILGAFLGNGRDRGLIGITFKLIGSAKQPQIIVNPISVIAPGIFRSIFEF
ncbi:MAG: DUF3971 domain-containing protein [Phyllobacterium sp.]